MSELVAKPITVCGIDGFREVLDPPNETAFACRTPPCRAASSAFYEFGGVGILHVICPTCQANFAESEVLAIAGLLCMGLFSRFWLGARAWPQAGLDVSLIDPFRFQDQHRYQAIHANAGPVRRMTAPLRSILC